MKKSASLLFAVALLLIIIAGCTKYTNEERQILDFIESSKKPLTKDAFEFLEYVSIDTLRGNEEYKMLIFFADHKKPAKRYSYYADPAELKGAKVPDNSRCGSGNYPYVLFCTLNDFHQYDKFEDYKRVVSFLHYARANSEELFDQQLLGNTNFVDSLRYHMTSDVKPFTDCFDSDSLSKYINIAQQRRRTMLGYLYIVRFRSGGKLNSRYLFYNSKGELVKYKRDDI